MNVVSLPRFWIAFLLTFVGLSGSGAGLAWMLVPAPPAYYRTSYFEFPLPADWECDEQGTERVCRPAGQAKSAAIIVLTAKWRGPEDTPALYLEHLKTPRNRQLHDGRTLTSEILDVRERTIGKYRWVDARHLSSELENYQTRYLAAVTAEIAVLITYSIHKDRVAEYDKALNATVEGLRIFQRPAD